MDPVKITRTIMLLLHGFKKIKKLLPFFTHSGLNKLYISLASLGEIKNLFVPCSFRAGNNFFIFFHPFNIASEADNVSAIHFRWFSNSAKVSAGCNLIEPIIIHNFADIWFYCPGRPIVQIMSGSS